jgi:small conductance mechanosensitive channel
VAKAQEAVTTREAEVREAEAQARSIVARVAALRESIAAERTLLKTAQQQQDNSHETKRVLNEELQTRWGAGATWAELRELREKVAEADQRIAATRQEIRERSDRLDLLQSQLSELQADEIAAAKEAEGRRQQAEAARRKLAELSNPFSPANLLQWVLDHGPRILGIAFGMLILLTLSRVLERRLVPVIARHSRGTAGTVEDRENRARTLLGVFHNAVRIVVVVGGSLMLLAELGMNIVPLITAAGVVGLAIAFGAQNLIRDYFYGFIILLENQYTINDVVRIGDISGLVERITLRITVLRDLEGVVHFVPHGEAKAVSNLTHGWSRAVFDVGVAYKENPDRVMKVLMDLGRDLRRAPEYSAVILDDPEMLGVDRLGDSAVIIRFLIKTRPQKQWVVKREMLRRIKNRFDELGIEIPFPQQTVYHRYEVPDGGEPQTPRLPQWEEGPYVNR